MTGDACAAAGPQTTRSGLRAAEPYAIKFRSGYEPYVLVARKIMPWYDERFRGYGWDKVHCRPCLWPSKGLTPGNRSLLVSGQQMQLTTTLLHRDMAE